MKRLILGAALALAPMVSFAHTGPELKLSDVIDVPLVNIVLASTGTSPMTLNVVCPIPSQGLVQVACSGR